MTTPNANSPNINGAPTPLAYDFKPCLWVLLGVLAVFPLFAAYGYTRFEIHGIISAATAATVVLLGMESALVVVILFRDTEYKIHSVLAGIFLQSGIPLVFGLLMHEAGGPLAEAGIIGMILVYYLLALIAKTILAVQLVSQTSIYKKAA